MNIFQVMANNLRRGPVTLRYPDRVALPKGWRGRVRLDPAHCTGCATCAYVCTSSAIGVRIDGNAYAWDYDPGACTFCGRCVDSCPTRALSMEVERPPVYMQTGALRQSYRMAFPLCPACGRPAHPVNEALLRRAFDEIGEAVQVWSRLCDRCRSEYQTAKALASFGSEER